jgi:hypothetical protein
MGRKGSILYAFLIGFNHHFISPQQAKPGCTSYTEKIKTEIEGLCFFLGGGGGELKQKRRQQKSLASSNLYSLYDKGYR